MVQSNIIQAAINAIEANKLTEESKEKISNEETIKIARAFFSETCPQILLPSNAFSDDDRLIKAGRNIVDTIFSGKVYDNTSIISQSIKIEASLKVLIDECKTLSSEMKIPKVRFGKTNLQISIVTLGGMRLQQAWGPRIKDMSQVTAECQENLMKILRHAISLGINHIETAALYGCSELQYGHALKALFDSKEIRREDLIIQTKVSARSTAKEFREALEICFKKLQLDYIDLFALHGLNSDSDYDRVFNNGSNGNCIDVVKEYVAKGKIRHVGFSSHGTAALIRRLIETDKFDYVNLHYHFFDSYTASGQGKDGAGNRENVRLMKEKDLGSFCISPYDKGGKLYAPSTKLRSLCLPDMEPITFGSLWLWNHERLDAESGAIHTIVCGAARPSDLDQPSVAAMMHGTDPEGTGKKVDAVVHRLENAMEEALGKEWVDSWYLGLPSWVESRDANNFTQIVGLYNLIRSYGMIEYAKERYGNMIDNLASWDFKMSRDENLKKLLPGGFNWMPGCAICPEKDYSHDFQNCPIENTAKVIKAIQFVHNVCRKDMVNKTLLSDEEVTLCKTAYDMRPWTAFPERG